MGRYPSQENRRRPRLQFHARLPKADSGITFRR